LIESLHFHEEHTILQDSLCKEKIKKFLLPHLGVSSE
jgi:hypothetical protein